MSNTTAAQRCEAFLLPQRSCLVRFSSDAFGMHVLLCKATKCLFASQI